MVANFHFFSSVVDCADDASPLLASSGRAVGDGSLGDVV